MALDSSAVFPKRHTHGTAVARSAVVARRITALFAIVALVALLVILVWRVYLHHEHGTPEDEPAVVSQHARPA